MKKLFFLLLFVMSFVLCSCGGTKVAVNRPTNGTYTTITVTTNNPITTDVAPSVKSDVTVSPSKQQ